MDGSKFDNLARALGQGRSRRTLLRGVMGGILAGGGLARHGAAAGRDLVICHATGDPNAPYQSLTIQQAEFNLYARHGDFLRVECCVDGDCPHQDGACGSGICQTGYCVQLPVAYGTSCDDGLACTANATCDGAFTCVGVPVVCAETANPCTTSVCSESGGGCQEVPIADGTTCGASDACADHICSAGSCVGVPKTTCSGNCADCGGACVDLNSDRNNCQTCGNVCDGGSECAIATCSGGSCGATPTNEGGDCTTSGGDAGVCASGVCTTSCPTGTECLFEASNFSNAIGVCANGECTCKPSGVAGLCDCRFLASVAGCCSQGCSCGPGSCL